MPIEKTFIIIKPDGVQRQAVGEILSRFERRGFKIVAMKLIRITEEMASVHYAEHIGKNFYPSLLKYITSGPVVVAVLEALDAVNQVRRMVGATDPLKAEPGTIRADYAQELPANVIHASDSITSAEREIGLYFKPHELIEYELDIQKWLLSFE